MSGKKVRYNTIKEVLVRKEKTNGWLAEKMAVAPVTVSRWCTNDSQPDIPNLFKIAQLLEVDVPDLLNWKK